MLRRIHPWSSLFKLDMDVWACLIHCQHFHRCIDWLMKHKKIKWFFSPQNGSLFFISFLTAQTKNMVHLLCSWCTVGTMSRCRAAVRGCAAAVKGVEEGAEVAVAATFVSHWKFRKNCETMLKIVLLAC